jgi:phosphoribosylanthranilate isomerase
LANYKDALDATNLGADFLGFHFIKESPKKVSEKMVKGIIAKLPPFVVPIGLFADEEKVIIDKTLKKTGLKNVEFCSKESPEFCESFKNEGIKVLKFFKVESEQDLKDIELFIGRIDYLVIDAFSLKDDQIKPNMELILKIADFGIPFFVAGKNSFDDAKEILNKIMPFAIDFDTEIERLPKRKDYDKMSKAIQLVHGLKL